MNLSIQQSVPINEDFVGISMYMTPEYPGISGILKQRFSDFIVREIAFKNPSDDSTRSSEVIYLKDIQGEEFEKRVFKPVEQPPEPENPVAAEIADKTPVEIADLVLSEILKIYPLPSIYNQESVSQIELKSFLVQAIEKQADCPYEFFAFPYANDKTVRSSIHTIIRNYIGTFMDSGSSPVSTSLTELVKNSGASPIPPPTASNENWSIRFLPRHKQKINPNKSQFARKRKFSEIGDWPKDCPDYLEFTLMKENIDTMSAVYVIAKHSHMKTEHLYYNGTKDKRGITTQRISVYRKKPSDFKRINAYGNSPYIRLGDWRYTPVPCKLGQLDGNRFTIVLRSISSHFTIDQINEICSKIQLRGFVNYFGLQRFGKGGSQSHEIGKAILQNHWKQCVQLLFAFRGASTSAATADSSTAPAVAAGANEKEFVIQAKLHFQEGNYQKAHDLLPDAMFAEKSVLKALISNPEDYSAAYHRINKNMRLICVHAYQSYLWNHAASKRIALSRSQVMIGDLVLANKAAASLLEQVDDVEELPENTATGSENSKETQQSSSNTANNSATGATSDEIHTLTEEDIAANRYSMEDIVLPLVGYESVLPSNEIGQLLIDLMAADGLNMESFRKCHVIYRMRGGYRRLLGFARDMQWSVKSYSDPQADLVVTELDQFIQRRSSNRPNDVQTVEQSDIAIKTEPSAAVAAEIEQQQLRALILEFNLSPGSYATMFLREITKESTESDFQAQLSSARNA
jgi:tRNA pseudouridine13 synthase